MQNTAILPLFYLPPVSYFTLLKQLSPSFLIEKQEHFPKQTYRNRASIYSPNGKLDLIVPVIKGSKVHTLLKDVKISYDFNWQRSQWMGLQSCYRNSAYFEFYEDELAPFYHQKFDYLFDYNTQLLTWVLQKLKLPDTLQFTTKYLDNVVPEMDFRNYMNPKKINEIAPNKTYYQVFEDKHQFIPNLSIADLLFNQGPQAKLYF